MQIDNKDLHIRESGLLNEEPETIIVSRMRFPIPFVSESENPPKLNAFTFMLVKRTF